jgi:hypothetical protein
MENEFISMSAFCQRFSLLNDEGQHGVPSGVFWAHHSAYFKYG